MFNVDNGRAADMAKNPSTKRAFQHMSHVWTPDTHSKASREVCQIVRSVTLIRSLHLSSPFSLLPNELLFEIFYYLRPTYVPPRRTPT